MIAPRECCNAAIKYGLILLLAGCTRSLRGPTASNSTVCQVEVRNATSYRLQVDATADGTNWRHNIGPLATGETRTFNAPCSTGTVYVHADAITNRGVRPLTLMRVALKPATVAQVTLR